MLSKEVKRTLIYIVSIILAVAIAFVITWTFFTRFLMQGFSMSPSINNRDIVFVNRLHKNLLPLSRYDVIVFYINDKENIKRIIGLPGDKIKISSSNIYVNDVKVDDKYFNSALSSYTDINTIVGEDEYYVLGDNLDSSRDSRFENVGNVHKSQIIGKVWRVFKQ